MLRNRLINVQILRLNPILKMNIQKRFNNTTDFFEPPYLKNMRPSLPVYETLTVQFKGWDFKILENYQRFAHNIANYMGFTVEESWGQPGQHFTVNRFRKQSTTTETSYNLIKYERNLKLSVTPATKLSIYSEVLQTALPEGVELNIFPFNEEHYKIRFVPDHELDAKMKELNELGGPPDDEEPPPLKLK